ncbi:MAG: NfeD family protein, partial [Planctomycetota bacterium]
MDAIKEFLKPEIIWFLVGLALLIMEFAMPGLIIAFFGIGACIVAIVCMITDIGINTQLIV